MQTIEYTEYPCGCRLEYHSGRSLAPFEAVPVCAEAIRLQEAMEAVPIGAGYYDMWDAAVTTYYDHFPQHQPDTMEG